MFDSDTDLKIDIGCGSKKREGYLGLDIKEADAVDMVCDVTEHIPLPDNSVSHVYSYHALEHLTSLGIGSLTRELARVCKKGADLDLWAPYWTHYTAYNLSHKSYLSEHTFQEDFFIQFFRVVRFEYSYTESFENLPEEEREYARNHFWNVVKEFRIVAVRK